MDVSSLFTHPPPPRSSFLPMYYSSLLLSFVVFVFFPSFLLPSLRSFLLSFISFFLLSFFLIFLHSFFFLSHFLSFFLLLSFWLSFIFFLFLTSLPFFPLPPSLTSLSSFLPPYESHGIFANTIEKNCYVMKIISNLLFLLYFRLLYFYESFGIRLSFHFERVFPQTSLSYNSSNVIC